MYLEKREEEDLLASKTALTHRYIGAKTTKKNLNEDWLQPSETIRTTRQTIKWQQLGNKNGKRQLYGRFKRLINNITQKKTWTWLRKGNLNREMESLLILAQDNAIRTNHIKARIDKTQQNSKCRLCSDRDETINHIISECSKLAQKEYKVRHDWAGKMIHWEMCKKFKFNHTNKWYMHSLAPVLENDTHKLLWDFNIQTDHLIPARRLDLIIIIKKKRICKAVDFAVPADHRINLKKCEKKDKYLDLARELKKLWNMKVTIVLIVIGTFGTITKGSLKGLEDLDVGGLSKWQHCRERPESWDESWRLEEIAVTQTPVKNHQLTLMWKTLKE